MLIPTCLASNPAVTQSPTLSQKSVSPSCQPSKTQHNSQINFFLSKLLPELSSSPSPHQVLPDHLAHFHPKFFHFIQAVSFPMKHPCFLSSFSFFLNSNPHTCGSCSSCCPSKNCFHCFCSHTVLHLAKHWF